MKRKVLALLLALPLLLLLIKACPRAQKSSRPANEDRVIQSDFSVWTPYEGLLNARRVETVMSRFNGSATIVEMAPEGAPVKAGDLLVRFDCSNVERDYVRMKLEFSLAKGGLESLRSAEIPLERQDLQTQLADAKLNYNIEKQFLEDSRQLRKEDLVSEAEIKQQEFKVEQAQSKLEQLELKVRLTDDFLHPSKIDRAQANLAASEQQLNLIEAQLSNCVIVAPSDGSVVYNPVNIGSEFRTLRVGDTVYKNQPFILIPDMSDLIVKCYLPEIELSKVQAGNRAVIRPFAYPDLKIEGEVEKVSAMAQTRPGYPVWQKYFQVTIRLKETDARLRTGISVYADILSLEKPQAVLIPRAFVRWENRAPFCSVRKPFGIELCPLELGASNEKYFEVLGGVKPGDRVVLE